MSFLHSNTLVKSFREGVKAAGARQRIADAVVQGRARGCTVRYTGCGRVEDVSFNEEAERGLRCPASGRILPELVSRAVKEAVLNAQQQMTSVKQAEWHRVSPRVLTECM